MELQELRPYIQRHQPNICQISVLRDGNEICSAEWNGYQRTDCVHIASATKSVMALLLALPACGKTPLPGKSGQDASPMESAEGPADVTPSADTGISSGGDTPESQDAPADGDTAPDDAWKAEFEKSLLENYGVKPDHYEELDNGVYQVYVEIEGKFVPYVAVDSATGDYHG